MKTPSKAVLATLILFAIASRPAHAGGNAAQTARLRDRVAVLKRSFVGALAGFADTATAHTRAVGVHARLGIGGGVDLTATTKHTRRGRRYLALGVSLTGYVGKGYEAALRWSSRRFIGPSAEATGVAGHAVPILSSVQHDVSGSMIFGAGREQEEPIGMPLSPGRAGIERGWGHDDFVVLPGLSYSGALPRETKGLRLNLSVPVLPLGLFGPMARARKGVRLAEEIENDLARGKDAAAERKLERMERLWQKNARLGPLPTP